MLILRQLFDLGDEEVEFQGNDRRSFEDFVGLGVINSISDAVTVAFFRERLRTVGGDRGALRGVRGLPVFAGPANPK